MRRLRLFTAPKPHQEWVLETTGRGEERFVTSLKPGAHRSATPQDLVLDLICR
jgi:hypothetical protein